MNDPFVIVVLGVCIMVVGGVFWQITTRLVAALESAQKVIAMKHIAEHDPVAGRILTERIATERLANQIAGHRDLWTPSGEPLPQPPSDVPEPEGSWETLGFLGGNGPTPSMTPEDTKTE